MPILRRMHGHRQIRVPILDLGCGGAEARRLERALASTDGVLTAYVNPATETVYVDVDPAEVDGWTITRIIAHQGFRPGRYDES